MHSTFTDVHEDKLDKSMMTSSNGNIFRITDPLSGEFIGPGEFPTQRPVTRSFDVFFDLRLNKRLDKQPWGWWFETPSWSLWRQCNVSTQQRKWFETNNEIITDTELLSCHTKHKIYHSMPIISTQKYGTTKIHFRSLPSEVKRLPGHNAHSYDIIWWVG